MFWYIELNGNILPTPYKSIREALDAIDELEKSLGFPRLLNGAESRNRTGTGAKSQQILSLLRLPVPPYPH